MLRPDGLANALQNPIYNVKVILFSKRACEVWGGSQADRLAGMPHTGGRERERASKQPVFRMQVGLTKPSWANALGHPKSVQEVTEAAESRPKTNN